MHAGIEDVYDGCPFLDNLTGILDDEFDGRIDTPGTDQGGERVHDDPLALHGPGQRRGINSPCVGHALERHGVEHQVCACSPSCLPELLCQEFKTAQGGSGDDYAGTRRKSPVECVVQARDSCRLSGGVCHVRTSVCSSESIYSPLFP
jgi:hypothetical protein